MPEGDLSELAYQARQRSEAFMQRSREQMFQTLQAQPQALGGRIAPAVGGGAAAANLANQPQAGTPAGRLLDTITDLVRRGTAFGAGAGGMAAGAVAQPVASGYGAATQAAGGGVAFLAGAGAFGPAGTSGGTQMDVQQRMNFFQTLFTAYGSGLPFGLGRYAAQRTDMEAMQARIMAREDLAYSMAGGAQRGLYGALNLASFGLSNFYMRRRGMLLETTRSQEFSRTLQSQLRFLTRDALEEAGLGGAAGPFATGVSREGAQEFAGPMMRQLGRLEREMGLAPSEIMALRDRAMGTLGTTGIERAVRRGGAEGLAQEVGRQTTAVRDIQQTLNLSEDEAQEFFQTIGQMYGTAERVADMAREARRASGRWGISKREVFDVMREFEDMGRSMAIGQGRAREAGMDYVGALRAQQRAGLLTREELMMYGGRTGEEALRIQARTRFQAGVGLYQRGALGGLGMMMTQNRGAFMEFMSGRMGPMEVQGAVAQTLMNDPWAGMTARYDPRTEAMAGRLGWLTQYQRVAAEEQGGFFLSRNESERIRRFQNLTGMQNLEAARWYRSYEREQNRFREIAQGDLGVRDPGRVASEMQGLYHRLQAEGMGAWAQSVAGRDMYEAAAWLWEQAATPDEQGVRRLDPNRNLEAVLLAAGRGRVPTERISQQVGGILSRIAIPGGLDPAEHIPGLGRDPSVRFEAQMELGPQAPNAHLVRTARRIASRRAAGFLREMPDISGAVRALSERGAQEPLLTELLFGGRGRAPGIFGGAADEQVSVNVTPGGRVRVSHESLDRPREVALQDLVGTINQLDLPTPVRHQIINEVGMRLSSRLKYLRGGGLQTFLSEAAEAGRITSGPMAAYNRFLMGRYSQLAGELFPGLEVGETALGSPIRVLGAPETMPEMVRRVANLEGLRGLPGGGEEFRRIQGFLQAQGLEGVMDFARSFRGTSRGGLTVQNWGRLSRLFGATSDTASSLQAAIEAAGVDIGGLDIQQALQEPGQARQRLERLLTMSPVATQIFNQIVGSQERENVLIHDGSSPEKAMFVKLTETQLTAIKERT